MADKAGFFNVGSNLCQRFVAGWPDDPGRFFLCGEHIDGKPVISARVFSHEGEMIFELMANELTARSLPVYRRIGFHNGWRIADEHNREVLTIETTLADTAQGSAYVTTINGELYDHDGNRVMRATARGTQLACPFAMGWAQVAGGDTLTVRAV